MQIETIGLDDIRDDLKAIEDKTEDIKPLLKELANHLTNTIEESFEDETSPDGTKWTPIKFRKGDHSPSKILYDHGHMQNSLHSRVYKQSLTIGVNATADGYQYPLVHQFGTKDKKIEARPFMPIKLDGSLYDNTEKELGEIVENHFKFLD
ncbi:phage virion morphogenesis protein [Sulfurimonas sp.]